jgi:hypothetical protein
MTHGMRSQSGVRVRSKAAWKAYLARRVAAILEAERREALRAGWREREAAKAAR